MACDRAIVAPEVVSEVIVLTRPVNVNTSAMGMLSESWPLIALYTEYDVINAIFLDEHKAFLDDTTWN